MELLLSALIIIATASIVRRHCLRYLEPLPFALIIISVTASIVVCRHFALLIFLARLKLFGCEQAERDAPADSGSALTSSSSVSLSRYLVAWAARLGWRNPSASARLLECLAWAKASLM